MGWQVLSPLLPRIIDDLHITSTQAGFAITLMWGLYALSQYPSGRLSDHLSRKTLLASGLVLLSIGFLIVSGTI
jgi:predicted MFS family arabinose efflux permease